MVSLQSAAYIDQYGISKNRAGCWHGPQRAAVGRARVVPVMHWCPRPPVPGSRAPAGETCTWQPSPSALPLNWAVDPGVRFDRRRCATSCRPRRSTAQQSGSRAVDRRYGSCCSGWDGWSNFTIRHQPGSAPEVLRRPSTTSKHNKPASQPPRSRTNDPYRHELYSTQWGAVNVMVLQGPGAVRLSNQPNKALR